jgi:acyl-CoA synthetase (AMP-forming)/AMP-acid ligase II
LVRELVASGEPDWVALEADGRSLTIRELDTAMRRAGGVLAGTDGPVAVRSADPLLHTVGVLGAVAAGRVAMLVDHRQPADVVAEALERAGATTVVGDDGLSLEDLVAGDAAEPVAADPAAPGSIFLTSGSTGRPKLVQRSRNADLHAAMCLRLAGFPIDLGDRHWMCVPYASAAFLTLTMGALLARATVVFAPFDRDGVDAFLARERISSAYLVPTMLRLARERDGLEGPGWQGMRALMTGGEKLDLPTAEVLADRFAGRVFCAYGMTECPRLTQARFEEIVQRPGTVGRTIPFRHVRIAALDGHGDVAPGEEGEVLVGGPDLYDRYVGEEPVDGWHRTGDLGRVDADGYLYITGRASSVVKVGGNRVSTEEVAAQLRRHERVAQVAVIAVEDAMWTNRLVAFVVAAGDLDEEDLRAWAAERLAAYKVPREVRRLDDLPVDSSGKLSLTRLHALAALPA